MIEAADSWTKAEQTAVVQEGARLLAFVAAGAEVHDMQIIPAN